MYTATSWKRQPLRQHLEPEFRGKPQDLQRALKPHLFQTLTEEIAECQYLQCAYKRHSLQTQIEVIAEGQDPQCAWKRHLLKALIVALVQWEKHPCTNDSYGAVVVYTYSARCK